MVMTLCPPSPTTC
ncbi:hypothetical protein EYF80_067942 [Liparis tanakae]|uniref:Uncharacterized protein n=1 Tax=Liparis tanakae TaxID=230148 RepID=A0A4Z2DZJ5_9TELE|nr:hypothetical protein EYF80_067942 [Liparis tanakae]